MNTEFRNLLKNLMSLLRNDYKDHASACYILKELETCETNAQVDYVIKFVRAGEKWMQYQCEDDEDLNKAFDNIGYFKK